MRLLILTQKMDRSDPVLGFFHAWAVFFSSRWEEITVLCLEQGAYSLPDNVRVFSLGKEKSKVKSQKSKFKSRLIYIVNFYRYIFRERKNYDVVLVHMNQEYVLLGGLFWKLFGKRVYLWRNHYAGNTLTDIAAFFCTKVFCTSRFSYTAKYKKTMLMPVGIDTSFFTPGTLVRERNSIFFLSRMAPSKKPEVLLGALETLKGKGIYFRAFFYGSPLPKNAAYYERLRSSAQAQLKDLVAWHPAVPNEKTPALYQRHEIFVNCSASGMLDKTIFEAMACGALTLSSSRDLGFHVDPRLTFTEGDSADLSRKLAALLALKGEEEKALRKQSRDFVIREHSLALLSAQLARAMAPRRALLFHNGSIGDFLMFVYLAEQLWESGQFSGIEIIVPRNAAFLRELIREYPYIAVHEVSLKRPLQIAALFRGKKTVLIHPTIGRIPVSVKLLGWFLSRAPGSELIGFRDTGPLCSLYSKVVPYDIDKPYIDTLRDLALLVGGHADTAPPRLRFSPSPEALARYGLEAKKYVVFHPGGSNPKHRFTTDASAELVAFILKTYPQMKVVLSCGADERDFIEGIMIGLTRLDAMRGDKEREREAYSVYGERLRDAGNEAVRQTRKSYMKKTVKERVVPAIGTSTADIGSLVYFSRLFIGTDTGITHLSCFLGVPVLEVAHNTRVNLLVFYALRAIVLYRLKNDTETRTDEAYMRTHTKGILEPFGEVPVTEVCHAVERILQSEGV